MKKLLLAGLPVLIVIMALPFVVTLMVVMTTTAAAECRTQTSETALTELGDLGAVDGPLGGPVKGTITMASAEEPPTGDVFAQLMQLRFASSYPTLTTEQARNAITIAQVARDLQVPRYGLQVATATANQGGQTLPLRAQSGAETVARVTQGLTVAGSASPSSVSAVGQRVD